MKTIYAYILFGIIVAFCVCGVAGYFVGKGTLTQTDNSITFADIPVGQTFYEKTGLPDDFSTEWLKRKVSETHCKQFRGGQEYGFEGDYVSPNTKVVPCTLDGLNLYRTMDEYREGKDESPPIITKYLYRIDPNKYYRLVNQWEEIEPNEPVKKPDPSIILLNPNNPSIYTNEPIQ